MTHMYYQIVHGQKMLFHYTQESPRKRRQKSRAANKVARRSRRINRLRGA